MGTAGSSFCLVRQLFTSPFRSQDMYWNPSCRWRLKTIKGFFLSPLQDCVPSYQRRTANTLRISSRPSGSKTAEASSQTALAVTGELPAPPPIPQPMGTEQQEEAATARPQTRDRRPLRGTSGTAWSPTSAMTLKLSAAVWTRRELHSDMADNGKYVCRNWGNELATLHDTPVTRIRRRFVLSTDPRFVRFYFSLIVRRKLPIPGAVKENV